MSIVSPTQGRLIAGCLASRVLGGRRGYLAYLPPSYGDRPERRYPCVWLLHDRGGTETDWVAHGLAHLAAEQLMAERAILELLLVFPNDGLAGEGSLWRNGSTTGPVADYFAELMDHIEATLRVRPEHQAHSLVGLGMGGYGALHLADVNRRRVGCAYSHAGALGRHWDPTLCERLVEGHRGAFRLRLGADCGLADALLAENRQWHEALAQARVPHIYREPEGGHTWDYAARHIEDSLRFVNEALTTP